MNKLAVSDATEFKPNVTPKRMIELGIFGGTYWRDLENCLDSKMMVNDYKKLPPRYWKNLPEDKLKRPYANYDKSINKYKVKTGTTYDFWCKKKWIRPSHPRGWYHWYCNYYYGKRSDFDEDEKKRWERFCGPKGRFRLWLITEISKKNGKWNDYSISPKLRQNCLEWGYQLTKADYDKEINRRKSLKKR